MKHLSNYSMDIKGVNMFFIHSDTFEGDDYGYGLFKGFLDGFIEKFYDGGFGHTYFSKDSVIEDLFNNPSNFETALTGHDLKNDKDFVTHMKDIAKYTRDFTNSCNPNDLLEVYESEWKSVHNGYHIAQYNAIKLSNTLKAFAAIFTRKQLFEVHKLRVESLRRTNSYNTKQPNLVFICMSSIDSYGIYDPFPKFKNVKDEPQYLTTRHIDIHNLKPLFDKYNLVKWKTELTKDGFYESYYSAYSCSRILGLINELKYRRMNLGKIKGRKVLDISNKSVYHSKQLNQSKSVTGYWEHNQRTYRKGVQFDK